MKENEGGGKKEINTDTLAKSENQRKREVKKNVKS